MKIVSSSSAVAVAFVTSAVIGSVHAGNSESKNLRSPAEAYGVASNQEVVPLSNGGQEGFFPGFFGGPFRAAESRNRFHQINDANLLNRADSLRFAKRNKEFDNVDFAKKIAFNKQHANENAKSVAKDNVLAKKNVFNKVAAESNNNAAAGFFRRRLDESVDLDEDDNNPEDIAESENDAYENDIESTDSERRLSIQGQKESCGGSEGCGGVGFGGGFGGFNGGFNGGFSGFGFGPRQDFRSANAFKQISNAQTVDAANRLRFNAVNRNANNVNFAEKVAFAKQHARDNAIAAEKNNALSKKKVFNQKDVESKTRCVTGVC